MSVIHVLNAIYNIIAGRYFSLQDKAVGSNRINRVGEGFEVFVRRALANDFESANEVELTAKTQHLFSYASSNSSPPDLMIRGGDAIEIKKFEAVPSTIQLNSSYPKAFLYSDYPLLSQECRHCEVWTRKDLVYILAVIKKGQIQEIWLVDGACYAAERDVYEAVFARVKDSVHLTQDLRVLDSELGRIIDIDPLKRTQLRIRGMWLIQHPRMTFGHLFNPSKQTAFSIKAIMRQTKYADLISPNLETELTRLGCRMTNATVLDPNNRAKVMAVKTIQFEASYA